jgi:hypothetical protein
LSVSPQTTIQINLPKNQPLITYWQNHVTTFPKPIPEI